MPYDGGMGKTYNERMLLAVREAIVEAVASGTYSANISAGGGSESFTRYSLSQLQDMERDFSRRVNAERRGGRRNRTLPDFGGLA